MGMFNRFKKNTEVSAPESELPHSALFRALDKLKKTQDPAAMAELSRVLKAYVDDGTWVPMPAGDAPGGYQLRFIESQDKLYAAMYSEQTEVKARGRILVTDINKLLEPVFKNPEIAGIVIDPDTTCMCIDKGFFLKCVLHGYLPKTHNGGCPQKDWGEGIPQYSQTELMTEGELLNFAKHTVLDNEEALTSLTPVSACDHLDAVPNFIFENNGRFVFVVVKGYCAQEAPVLSDEFLGLLQSYRKRFGAICYYAPVGFRSATDRIRFDACLALKGDGFYSEYEGLSELFPDCSGEKNTTL